MSKFKVGDKVRRVASLDATEAYRGMHVGTEDEVVGTSPADLSLHLKVYGWGHSSQCFELIQHMEERHVHHDLIIAWAKGAKLQEKFGEGWWSTDYPNWSRKVGEVRIKPEPKPDVVLYARACKTAPKSGCLAGAMMTEERNSDDNVQFTFDGETGELKSVELIA